MHVMIGVVSSSRVYTLADRQRPPSSPLESHNSSVTERISCSVSALAHDQTPLGNSQPPFLLLSLAVINDSMCLSSPIHT
ncbi:hypothetical protein ACN38_g10047 [Penicillium nordicum]|uniref:Uncharacterized protein n=1 Tax=Penicillium nordicum TaxID=229535 RepID=A0A0M9WCC0_9EURO|nr:hypothetical protein ACN38_g10047 [Penicillium nordicum]